MSYQIIPIKHIFVQIYMLRSKKVYRKLVAITSSILNRFKNVYPHTKTAKFPTSSYNIFSAHLKQCYMSFMETEHSF